jgi:acylphosphatase
MRWWIRSNALELGLTGWARNLEDGRVEVIAEGSPRACEQLLARLDPAFGDHRPGRIESVVERWSAAGGLGDRDGAGFAER